jgi:hypothetical protein
MDNCHKCGKSAALFVRNDHWCFDCWGDTNQQHRTPTTRYSWLRLAEAHAPYFQWSYISSGTDVVLAFKTGYGWHCRLGIYPEAMPTASDPLYQGTPIWWMPYSFDFPCRP